MASHAPLLLVKDRVALLLASDAGVLGRAPEPAVVTWAHDDVSWHHLGWRRVGPEALEVWDLGSSNGTLLEGRPLAPHHRVTLRLGARIDIAGLGPWTLTTQRERHATYTRGTPVAHIREFSNLTAEVRVRVGDDEVLVLRQRQAELIALLHEHLVLDRADPLKAGLEPDSLGWVRRELILEVMYGGGRSEAVKFNKVLSRLKHALEAAELPDLLDRRNAPGGRPVHGAPAPMGALRLRRDGSWAFALAPPGRR